MNTLSSFSQVITGRLNVGGVTRRPGPAALSAVLTFLFAANVFAQIPVTVSGSAVTSPPLAGSYTSLANALAAVNGVTSYSTPGTIVLTCGAGSSETAPPTGLTLGSATLNPLLSSTNTITINTAGGGVTLNAGVGVSASPSATPDAIMKLVGADWVTIDGLTFTDGNSASATVAMEVGLGLFKLNAGDGSNNNTIQNCTFNMQRISNGAGSTPMPDGSWAIEVLNSIPTAATTSLTPTNGGTGPTNGTNSGNRFYANTINGGNGGIAFGGYAATLGVGPAPNPATFLGDLGNDVGGNALATGNNIRNFGGGATTSPSAGIRANNQWSVNISYNTLNNNNGGGVNHGTTLRGIYAQAGTSANATINSNTITLQGGATTNATTAIENGIGSTAASNTVSISNNVVNGAYTTATTGVFSGIVNSATAATVNINGNTVQGIAATNLAGTGTHVMIETGSPTNATVSGNSVLNLSRSGASGSWRGIKTTSPANLTISGNTIDGLSWTTPASTGGIDAIYGFSSAVNVTASNNIIRNLSTPTTGTITGINEFGVSGLKTFQNNQIYNFSTTAGGAGGATFRGISESTGSTNTYSGNVIYALNSTGATGGTGGTIVGITFSSGTTNNVTGNAIYDLSSNSTNALVQGVNIGGGTTNNLSNNLIGDLRATASTGNVSVAGIQAAGGTTNNIFHNTVNVASTTASASTFGTSAIYFSSSTPVNNLRNNVFSNTSTPGPTGGYTAAIRYTIAPTATNFPASNNNNFYYAGVPAANRVIYGEGGAAAATNGQQTIGAYKTYIGVTLPVAGREGASVSEIPNFVSTTGTNPITTFLKYDTSIATQIEQGGGLGTGISSDYAGTTRCPGGGCPGGSAAPDMGAWELAGIPADLTPPAISYVLLGNGAALGTRPFSSVTVTDATGVNIAAGTRPRVYYKKSTDGNVWNDNTSGTDGWKYAEASGAAGSPFSFTIDYSLLSGGTGVAVGDTIQYFVVAQDTVATPNVGINSGTFAAIPASVALTSAAFPIGGSINSYPIVPALTGTKTVCASGCDYPTLTAAGGAFAAVNGAVITGNLILEIAGDLTVGEDGSVALNSLSEEPAGSNFTLKIYPTGAPRAITSTTGPAGGFIRLNAADRVTIDGSIGGTGTDRSLTITEANTGTTSAVVWLQSSGSDGATSNTIRNLNVVGNSNTTTLIGIGMGSSTVGTASLGTNNSSNTIQNNAISKVQYGIFSQGASAVLKNQGNVVTKNVMNAASPNNVAKGGIWLGFENNIQVTGNTIDGVTQAASPDVFGIALGLTALSTTGFTGNEVTNATVSGNFIGKVTNTGTFSAVGISVASATSGTNLIANNSISGVGANGTSGDFGAGIFLGGGAGSTTQVWYNSISMSGTLTGGGYPNYALAIGGADPVVDVRDNVLDTTLVNGTGFGYAIGTASATFANLTSNSNDLFIATGATFAVGKTGSLSQGSGTDQATLAAWQTATGKDASSISADPLFNSATNLQPQTGSPLIAAGTPVPVTVDITGATRSGTNPTIGAWEAAIDTAPPAIGYTPLINTSSTSNRTFTNVTVTDPSGVNGTSLTRPRVYYKRSTDGNVWNDNTSGTDGWKWVEASGATSPFDFTIDYSLLNGGTGVSAGTIVQYFVVAQDLAGTPNVGINSGTFAAPPTSVALTGAAFPIGGTIRSYLISLTWSGGYSVPGTFASLTNPGGIFEAMNAGVLTGNVVIDIVGDLAGETGAVGLNQQAEEGAGAGTYTVTIRPSGAPRAITGTSTAPGLIRLFGADRVTIDGSMSGGTDRSLTITNGNASAVVVWIESASVTDGATGNTVKNCILSGVTGVTAIAGILSGSGVTLGNDAESPNSNNTVQNNAIYRVQNSLYLRGNTTSPDLNWLVTGNTMGSTVAADKNTFRGVLIGNAQGFTISHNVIRGVVSSTSSTSTMTGIQLAMNINGGSIFGNTISDIKQLNTAGWGSNGIYLAAATTASNVDVFDNFVFDVASYGYNGVSQGDNGYGIMVQSGGGYRLFHNSVRMTTNQTAATGIPAAINVATGLAAGALDVRDNIFANTQTVGTRYAIYCASPNTVFTNIDFNDYWPGTGILGYLGAAQATLAAWQTATGKDAASISADPLFVSTTDLHLEYCTSGSPAAGAGTPIASVTVDIDDDPRSATNPDIGADEVVKFTITASAGSNGAISPSGPVTVGRGCDRSFTITPAACYVVADVLVDGVSVGAVTSHTFTNVQASHTISASFAWSGATYTITASAGSNGSISPSGAVSVSCGNDQAFTITPDACYQVADVLVDGVSIGAVTSHTFTNVQAAHSISATFSLLSYTITASAGAGGSISPSGAVPVSCGASQSFTITPDCGYSISDVLVDGISAGAVASYNFTNVTAGHTIAASFTALPAWTITASAGANGTISPSGAVLVGQGCNQSFTITPDSGYVVDDVLVDLLSIGAVTSHTFTGVAADHTISATFRGIVGTVPDRQSLGAPLMLFKNTGTPANVDLSWGDSCGVGQTDFALYEGKIGFWYDHASKLGCTTGGGFSVSDFPPIGKDSYYLVVPLSASREGSYGRDSSGTEIPQGSGACFGTQDLNVCP